MAASITVGITENSTSVANNTSSVTVKVTAKWTYGTYDHTPPKLTVTIDGTKYTKSVSLNPNNTTSGSNTIYSKTLNIEHDSDGTKKLSVSASYATGTSSGTVKDSASKTLTTIARKSAPTCPSSGTLGTAITIATNRKSSSFTHTLKATWNGQSVTIATKTSSASVFWTPPISWCTVGSSGTCTITCTTYSGSTSLGSNTCSLTLYRPGTSELYIASSSCQIDGTSSVTIQTQGNYTAYTHQLYYTVNGNNKVEGIADTTVVGSTTFTPPLELLNLITTATSATCTVYLQTLYNGTVLASDSDTLTLIVPLSVIPTAEITAIADTVKNTASGDDTLLDYYGGFVAGKSIPQMTIAGTESYGSAIQSYIAYFNENGSITSSSVPITATETVLDGVTSFMAYVRDARWRNSAKVSKDVTVLSYSDPAIGTFTATRMSEQFDGTLAADDAGTILRVTYDITVSALNNKNSRTASLSWLDLTDNSSGTIMLSLTAYHAAGTLDIKDGSGYVDFSSTNRYRLTLAVIDDFGSASSVVVVQTAEVIMDFHSNGKGMAIGKISEGNGFECAYDADFTGSLSYKGKELINLIYPVGSIYFSASTVSPAALFGGTWERISGSFLWCGEDSELGTSGGEKTHTLTASEMPSHYHSVSLTTGSSGAHTHKTTADDAGKRALAYNYDDISKGVGERAVASSSSSNYYAPVVNSADVDFTSANVTGTAGAHTHSVSGSTGSTGSGSAHNNMPPYLSVCAWKRTA